ncbi:MAG: TonB-dependent receptor [Prevotellaceae bacterium]|jgi:TonB-linked SusC/RagA family outer membrane protein|nr:TonB-dependent receptor [Prevotellaceae bacterium]
MKKSKLVQRKASPAALRQVACGGAKRGVCLLMATLMTMMIAPASLWAQELNISGTVRDSKNDPLAGVSVVVKGTTRGVATDASGSYDIQASADATLVFSFMGMGTKEEPVNGRGRIDVILSEDNKALDEVVVIGYGVQRRSDVTGATALITSKDLTAKPVSNAFEAMQGKLAGVDITSTQRPGEIGDIRIRGNRSLNATNEPLYVVDGVVLSSGGIEALNPRDIESINILKDASSTAIYGSRGANGVVLVTTKRGTPGTLRLNYSGTVTIENLVDVAPVMNAADYITWRRWAYYNSNPNLYTPGDQPTKDQDEAFFNENSQAQANVMKGWESGTWNPSAVTNTDWTGMVTQTGITQEHTVSASGGDEKMSSFISLGYLNNTGTQKGQEFERYNLSTSTDLKPVKWFNMGGAINASWSEQRYGYSTEGQSTTTGAANDIYGQARKIPNFMVPFDDNGEPYMSLGGSPTIYTIYEEWNKSTDNRQRLRALGSFYAALDFGEIWSPLQGLKFKSNFGPDFSYLRRGVYIPQESAARQGSPSRARWIYERNFSWVLDNMLSYSKTLLDDHKVDVTLLQSASKYDFENASMLENNVPKDSYLWNNMGAVDITSSDAAASIGTNLTQSAMASYMGRLNYSFKDRYLLTVSGRYDGSSVLSEGHKWAFFPSAALGWRIDQESFMQNVGWVSALKLRLGVGVTGNSAIDPYATLGSISSYYVPFGGQPNALMYVTNEPYYTSDQVDMANPALEWEKTTQYNLGVDFSLLKGRIGGAIDIYASNTNDLIMPMKIPTLTGYSQTLANVGKTQNKGVEVSLNLIPVKVNDFTWASTLNAAYQKDEIVELANGKNDMPDNSWFIGQPINVWYGYANAGLWQESDADEMAKFNAKGEKFTPGNVRPVEQKVDSIINADDRVVLGQKNPTWTFGWTNTFSYKGIELSVELYGRMGYTISSAEGQLGMGQQRQIDYWRPDNTGAEWQKPIYSTAGGDPYSGLLGFKEASFLKVRNISLGYWLPSSIGKTLGISTLKVYAQLRNPGTIYSSVDFMYLDLEAMYYNRGVTLGIEIGF